MPRNSKYWMSHPTAAEEDSGWQPFWRAHAFEASTTADGDTASSSSPCSARTGTRTSAAHPSGGSNPATATKAVTSSGWSQTSGSPTSHRPRSPRDRRGKGRCRSSVRRRRSRRRRTGRHRRHSNGRDDDEVLRLRDRADARAIDELAGSPDPSSSTTTTGAGLGSSPIGLVHPGDGRAGKAAAGASWWLLPAAAMW